MERERFERADALFAEALERPAAERLEFVHRRAAGDAELARVVAGLLEADAGSAQRFFASLRSLVSDLAGRDEPLAAGDHVGPYRLVEVVGSGGMSTVFLAERDEFRHRVAVKVLRRGLLPELDEEVVRRFLAERQILAGLHHPNIAHFFDGGTTAGGQPFLVLEYVEGLPIDEYCDRHRLTVTARLTLFREVLAAVDHAHRNLLVHRDLKPGNVLVTAAGRPKLLDFGIAKLLAAEGVDRRFPTTRADQRLMTPEYASPEQVLGLPISTASDVYSLGVMLYELLCGRSPYRSAPAGRHELERAICEEEPLPPSAAWGVDPDGQAALARARGAGPRELRRRLRGDLDAIVLKALAKNPLRRYASVDRLAEDLRRHLEARPITARRRTAGYRTGRLLRRNRLASALVAALLAVLTASTVVAGRQASRIVVERDKAERALDLLVEVFESSDPEAVAGEPVTARQFLDAGARRLSEELTDEPEVLATLLDALGQAYTGLAMETEALPLFERSLELRREIHGPEHPETATGLFNLAEALYGVGRFEEAAARYREALALRRRLLGERHPEVAHTLNRLGNVLGLRGEREEAEALHAEALAIFRAAAEPDFGGIAEGLHDLGLLHRETGRLESAERLLREALDTLDRDPETRPSIRALYLNGLGLVLLDQGRFDDCEAPLGAAVRLVETELGREHPAVLPPLGNLGLAMHQKGDLERAEEVYRDVLGRAQAHYGRDSVHTTPSLNNLGALLAVRGKLEEARELQRTALEIRRRSFGPEHELVAQSLHHLGRLSLAAGDLEESRARFTEAVEMMRRALGAEHAWVSHPLIGLGQTLAASGDLEGARARFEEALALRRGGLPPDHWWIADAEGELGAALYALGRHAQAEPLLLASSAALRRQFPASDPRVTASLERLVELYRALGRPEEAETYERLLAEAAPAEPPAPG